MSKALICMDTLSHRRQRSMALATYSLLFENFKTVDMPIKVI